MYWSEHNPPRFRAFYGDNELGKDVVLVEFADPGGVAYAIEPIPVGKLIELRHTPAMAAWHCVRPCGAAPPRAAPINDLQGDRPESGVNRLSPGSLSVDRALARLAGEVPSGALIGVTGG